ncbi:putative glucosylceramidase 4 [Tribolium madens]|uniref:putative glucosylceramidase 4 n=1 Tax=Tribolium madens TaxID=41895 RepID=UPI001CF74839|nr:putative glucosylceramidase 4 [Tribolium madens]
MLVLLLVLSILSFSNCQQCQSRDYGNGGTVCVCNVTYCDTIARPQRVDSTQFLTYTSNLAGLRFSQTSRRFTSRPNSTNRIYLNSSRVYQTIIGWGGAFTDATGININSLPVNMREMLLESYFSQNGIEYSLGRVPIGGTDFSIRPYTYDDGLPDPELINFDLAPEDLLYKIPNIQRAVNLTNGNIRLFASAWTAPRWMKTNGDYSGYGFIRRALYQTWANYYVRFLDEYRQRGVNFWGITTGNEPADVLNPFDQLEVVGWPSWLIGDWILNNLGPTIRGSIYSNLTIMILDDQRVFLPWYVVRALYNNRTRQYIDGIAVHWYLDLYSSPDLLDETQRLFPEKFILGTEASIMPAPYETPVLLGSWTRGEEYSSDIIADMQHWVTGWVDWNMALNPDGGPNYIRNFVDSTIIVNATAAEFYKQPIYYHFGHFSKFVPRGSVRIDCNVVFNDNSSSVDHVAFRRPDNGTAIVILNRNPTAVSLNIMDNSRGVAPIEITAKSITTVLYW